MKTFLLGFLTAAALFAALCFYVQPPWVAGKLGRLMDEDVLYLRRGDVVRGWIVDERPEAIFIETRNGSYTLPRNSCLAIKKNVIGRYLRELP